MGESDTLREYKCDECRGVFTTSAKRGRLPTHCYNCKVATGRRPQAKDDPVTVRHISPETARPAGQIVASPQLPAPFNSTGPGRAALPKITQAERDAERDIGEMEARLLQAFTQVKSTNPNAEFLKEAALRLARAADGLDPDDIAGMLKVYSATQKILKDILPEQLEDSGPGVDPSAPWGAVQAELVPEPVYDLSEHRIPEGAQPRFVTRRRYERPTWGPFWGRIAAMLGRPFMPWQQLVADIAGEVDHNGVLCYRKIVLTVPRQSGKTTLVLSVVVGRAIAGEPFGGRQNMIYAAQTRALAADKLKDEYIEDLRRCKHLLENRDYKVRIGAGTERITFLASRSTFGPVPTKDDSTHGPVIDAGFLDEAFAQEDDRVPGAWRPAMITKPMAQMWFVSTMGAADAEWFNGEVEAGRKVAAADTGTGTAYIEYSAPDDRKDYDSPELWRTCMPALGFTQTEASIRAEYDAALLTKDGINGFRRPYLNQQVNKQTPSVLDLEKWAKMRTPDDAVRATTPVLAMDVNWERTAASMAVGYARADGTPCVRLVEHHTGTGWMVDKVLELIKRYDIRTVILDKAGPARSMIADLEREYVQLTVTDAGEMVAACGLFFDGVEGTKFRHFGELELELAVAGAERRELGDAWAWTRKRSSTNARTDISPLVACTLAYWGQLTHGDQPGDVYEGSFG